MFVAIKYWMVLGAARLFAFLVGGKIIVFRIEPRANGYSYVRSSALPGFAMVLEPGETNSAKSIIDALSDPLTAYLEAETRRSSEFDKGTPPRRATLRGWGFLDDKVIAAASCV